MRAFKNTTLTIGLASMPVGIASAIDSKSGNSVAALMRVAENEDGTLAEVEAKTVNAVTGEEVEEADLVQALDLGDALVKIDPKDLVEAKAATTLKNIEVEEFIPLTRLDPLAVKRGYFLQPQSKFPEVVKAMKLLYDGMKATKRMAVAKVCLRDRQARAVIVPHQSGALVLYAMEWASAIREPDADVLRIQEEKADPRQKKIMRELIESYSSTGDAFDAMEDDLSEKVADLIDGGIRIEVPVASNGDRATVTDVMEGFEATLAEVKKGKVKA